MKDTEATIEQIEAAAGWHAEMASELAEFLANTPAGPHGAMASQALRLAAELAERYDRITFVRRCDDDTLRSFASVDGGERGLCHAAWAELCRRGAMPSIVKRKMRRKR
jgi:hypothetical protein